MQAQSPHRRQGQDKITQRAAAQDQDTRRVSGYFGNGHLIIAGD